METIVKETEEVEGKCSRIFDMSGLLHLDNAFNLKLLVI